MDLNEAVRRARARAEAESHRHGQNAQTDAPRRADDAAQQPPRRREIERQLLSRGPELRRLNDAASDFARRAGPHTDQFAVWATGRRRRRTGHEAGWRIAHTPTRSGSW